MERKIRSFDRTGINYDISRAKSKKKNSWLIFIHGAGGDLTAWRKERYFFHKKGYSTIAIDLRGHGKSGRPGLLSDYRLENFAKDIYAIIKHEKIRNFIITGHCFGGMVAMLFHKLFPKLAKSYILIDINYKAPARLKGIFHNRPFFVHLLNQILANRELRKKCFSHAKFQRFTNTGDYDASRIFSDIMHTSFKSWIFTYENLSNFNAINVMKKINKPVLIIEGEKDSIFDLLIAQKIHRLIRNSRLDVVPRANHIIILNNPREIEAEMYSFTSSIKGF